MLNQIQSFIATASGQTTIIAIIMETLFRLVKTDKPLSIAHLIAAGAHQVGSIVSSIADFLDKILPQNVAK